MDEVTELKFESFPVEGMANIQGVEFKSYQSEDSNGAEIAEWLSDLGWDAYHEVTHSRDYLSIHEEIRIKMPTGTTTVNIGDWVMDDPNGQIYVLPQAVVWKKWSK